MAQVIVFSRDRAFQLDALLRSLLRHVADPPPATVIFRSTSRRHARAYAEVVHRHPWCDFVSEKRRRHFKKALIDAIEHSSADRLLFLVDDNLFINEVNFGALMEFDTANFVPSLRLGAQLTYCYTFDRPQPLPTFTRASNGFLTWPWHEGILDWGYPLSVDGHLFSRIEMQRLITGLPFRAPNTLERSLQVARDDFVKRRGVCYETSRLTNMPWNRVQTEASRNRHGDVAQNHLLDKWNQGFELDVDAYAHSKPISAHQEFPLVLRPRTDVICIPRGTTPA